MARPIIMEICPREPRASACLATGENIIGSDYEADILDYTASGDAEPACAYVRDSIGVDFRIVARNASGEYENRAATPEEKAETCRAIYFDSEADFTDEATADLYLIWQAASELEAEDA